MRALFMLSQREYDGSARALVDAAAALSARGHESAVATTPSSEVERVAKAMSLETVALSERPRLFGRTRELRRAIDTQFADLLVVTSERDLTSATWALSKDSRTVILRRIPTGEALARHWRSRMAERRSSLTYLLATESNMGLLEAPAQVISAPLGVRLPERPADLGDTLAPNLVCVAGSRRTRAIGETLRAYALLRQRFSRLRLTVLGSVAGNAELQLHAAALGVMEHVVWVADPLARDAALTRGTVGCVAADGDEEAFGYLDLMAAGIPFLARRTATAERYVSNGIHGVLLRRLEPARVASELAVMLASAKRREAMGAAGRARVEREFSDRLVASVFEQAARRVRERTRTGAVR